MLEWTAIYAIFAVLKGPLPIQPTMFTPLSCCPRETQLNDLLPRTFVQCSSKSMQISSCTPTHAHRGMKWTQMEYHCPVWCDNSWRVCYTYGPPGLFVKLLLTLSFWTPHNCIRSLIFLFILVSCWPSIHLTGLVPQRGAVWVSEKLPIQPLLLSLNAFSNSFYQSQSWWLHVGVELDAHQRRYTQQNKKNKLCGLVIGVILSLAQIRHPIHQLVGGERLGWLDA